MYPVFANTHRILHSKHLQVFNKDVLNISIVKTINCHKNFCLFMDQKKPPEGGLIKLVMNLKYIYKKYGITNAKVNPISNIPTDTK